MTGLHHASRRRSRACCATRKGRLGIGGDSCQRSPGHSPVRALHAEPRARIFDCGLGQHAARSGLNDLSWVLTVVVSFPTAMLIMAGSFGLWRSGIISNTAFTVGVTAMLLVLAGASAWAEQRRLGARRCVPPVLHAVRLPGVDRGGQRLPQADVSPGEQSAACGDSGVTRIEARRLGVALRPPPHFRERRRSG